MVLTNTRTINAAPAVVWAALNDPAILKECIPGCESLERITDTQWQSVVAARVGPVAVRFNARITLADIVPSTSYTLQFAGRGGAAGFANGEASVVLSAVAGGQTALAYTANATIGGKLAQIGSRLVDGVAAKLAEEFFARFAAQLAAGGAAPAVEAVAVAVPTARAMSLSPARLPPLRRLLYAGAGLAAAILVVAVLVLRSLDW